MQRAFDVLVMVGSALTLSGSLIGLRALQDEPAGQNAGVRARLRARVRRHPVAFRAQLTFLGAAGVALGWALTLLLTRLS
jgi:hypothetical protein